MSDWCTCFEGELILLLAIVVVKSSHADTFPSAGILLEWIPIPAVFVARVPGGLLIVGPLSRVGLVLLIAAHTGEERRYRLWFKNNESIPINMSHKIPLNSSSYIIRLKIRLDSIRIKKVSDVIEMICGTNLLRSPGGATWSVLGVGGAPSGFFFFGGAAAWSGLYSWPKQRGESMNTTAG